MKTFSRFKIDIEFEGKSQTLFVTTNSFVIGRSTDCEVPIDSKNLSRQHMKANMVNDQIFIEDLKSTNGCFYDGNQLEPGKKVEYKDDKRLTLGKHEDLIIKIYAEFETVSDVEKNVSVSEIKKDLKQVFNKDPMSLDDPAPKKAEKDYKEIMNQVEILKTEIIDRAEKRADKIIEDAKLEAEKTTKDSKDKSEDVLQQARLSADKLLADAVEQSKNMKEQSELADVLRNIEEKKTELDRVNEIIKTCRENLKSLELKNTEYTELEEKNTNLELSIKTLETKKNNLVENQKDIEAQLALSSENLEKINKEKDYIKTLVQDSESKNKSLSSENSKFESEIQKLTAKKEKLETEVVDIEVKRKDYNELNAKYNELQKDLENKNEVFKNVLLETQNVNTDLKALKDLQQNLMAENSKQQNQINLEKDNIKNLQKEFEDFQNKKTALGLEIEEVEKTKQNSIHELSELQNKLKVLEKEAAQKAQKANDEADLIISQAKAKAQSESIALIQKSKQDLIDKENTLLAHAKTQSQEILDKANAELRKVDAESKKITDEALKKAEEKGDRILKDSQQRADDLRDRAQAEYQRMVKEAEVESDKIKARSVEHMEAKKKDFVEFEKKRIRKSADLLKSELNVLLYSKLKLYLKEDSEDYSARIKSSLEAAVNSSMLSEVLENDAEMYAMLDDEVKIQQQKNINFWRYSVPGAFLSIIVIYFAFPMVKNQIKEKSREVASVSKQDTEERIKKKDEEAKLALFEHFDPKKTSEFKDTYTDRVLYTQGYAELSLEKEYREDWILELQTFFTDKLNLNENALVPFISQEANMIRELVEQSKKINGKFIEQGVSRMRDIEEEFLTKLKLNLKSERDYKKVIEFQKKFFNKKVKSKNL